MKTTNCAYLVLLVYGIISFELPVSCDPTNESQQDERPELIDVDIKNIYNKNLDVLISSHRAEVRKIAPKNNKIIKSINIDEDVIWKKSATSRCVNFLLFLTNGDKIFIVLNTKSDGQKFYINLVYDPTESVGSGISDAGLGGSKIRYIGLLPFIIELNEEFASMGRHKNEVVGVELNVKDIFDRWYYKYAVNNFVAHHLSDKPVLNHATFEPNERELFVKVTDSHRTIWIANPQSASRVKFCKKVEVFSKYNNIKLLRLTLVGGTYAYYRYNFMNDRWNKYDQTEFEKRLEELGFTESTISSEETGGISLSTSSKSELTDRAREVAGATGETGASEVTGDIDRAGEPSGNSAANKSTVSREHLETDKKRLGSVSDEMDTKGAEEEGESQKLDPKKKKTESVKQKHNTRSTKKDSGTNPENLTKRDLSIWEINSNDFYFIKNKVSLMRMVTIIPKVKRKVERLYYNDHEFRYIISEDFKIDFIKWKNSFHFTETVVKNDKNSNYFCHYLDKERSGKQWNVDTQDDFYRKMVHEFEYFDVDRTVRYKHFRTLDELSELAGQPNYKKLVKIN